MNTVFKFILVVFCCIGLSSCYNHKHIKEGFAITEEGDTIHFFGGNFRYNNDKSDVTIVRVGYFDMK